MAQRLIIGAAESRSQANRIVHHLINGGFAEDAVSVLYVSENSSGECVKERHLPAASAMAAKAGVGALLGGAFVWLNGMGTLSVPGLGSLIIAGTPLVAAAGRCTASGMADVLGKMGLAKHEARLRQGNILVSISVCGATEANAAKCVLRAIGLQDIADTAEAAALPGGTGHEYAGEAKLMADAAYG
jgi:hypothetical protein